MQNHADEQNDTKAAETENSILEKIRSGDAGAFTAVTDDFLAMAKEEKAKAAS